MLRHLSENNTSSPKEGSLYRVIDLHGCRFSIYYGYYDELDRNNPTVEPMPLYPDFIKSPRFTKEGYPFVTKMQDACPHYLGRIKAENECADCSYYCHGQDLIGICKCEAYRGADKNHEPQRRKPYV